MGTIDRDDGASRLLAVVIHQMVSAMNTGSGVVAALRAAVDLATDVTCNLSLCRPAVDRERERHARRELGRLRRIRGDMVPAPEVREREKQPVIVVVDGRRLHVRHEDPVPAHRRLLFVQDLRSGCVGVLEHRARGLREVDVRLEVVQALVPSDAEQARRLVLLDLILEGKGIPADLNIVLERAMADALAKVRERVLSKVRVRCRRCGLEWFADEGCSTEHPPPWVFGRGSCPLEGVRLVDVDPSR